MPYLIRLANIDDIMHMVALSYIKRRNYEKAQPQFWQYAGPKAENIQAEYFKELLSRDDHIILVASSSNLNINGFIIGKLMQALEVYNPGGLTFIVIHIEVCTLLLVVSPIIHRLRSSRLVQTPS